MQTNLPTDRNPLKAVGLSIRTLHSVTGPGLFKNETNQATHTSHEWEVNREPNA